MISTNLLMEDEKLRALLNFAHVAKTPERIKFESEHTCYVYSTRDENQYGYNIDCLLEYDSSKPEDFVQQVNAIKLRARMNMGQVRAVWLPNELGKMTHEHFDVIKSILERYSFKI